MVERPIKKSERQAQPADAVKEPQEVGSGGSAEVGTLESRSPVSNKPRPVRAKDRPEGSDRSERSDRGGEKGRDRKGGKGKGKGNRQEREDRPPVNMALMRGPRPEKAKVVEEPQEEEVVAEEATLETEETPTEE